MKFRDEYFFLSNFYPCKLEFNGRTYNNAEALFQSFKSKKKDYKDALALCTSAAEAKRLGKTVELRSDWEQIKDTAMLKTLQIKFSNPVLLKKLKNIEGYIQEDNSWNDTYWGVCRGVGQNKLGKLIMYIRDNNNTETAH